MNALEVSNIAIVWVADGSPLPGIDYGTRICEQLEKHGIPHRRQELSEARQDEPLSRSLNIITGGNTSVNDRDTWMPVGLRLVDRMIESALKGESKLFGVCLGSQMIAECLSPGCIVKGADIHVGLTSVDWADTSIPENPPHILPTFHYEQIDKANLIGSGAEILASKQEVPVLAYRYANIGATQLHPDFTSDDAAGLVRSHRYLIRQFHGDVVRAADRVERLAPHWSEDAFMRTLHFLLPG